MNLTTYLNELDELAAKLDRGQLLALIHELGRVLPAATRDTVLDAAEKILSLPEEKEEETSHGESHAKLQTLCASLQEIMDGKKCLRAEYNEDYDDWYDEGEEIRITDPQRLLPVIEQAVLFLQKCIDEQNEQEGFEIAEILSDLTLEVDGDWDDGPMTLKKLYEESLLAGGFENTVTNCLYLAYMANDTADRPDQMFELLQDFDCYSVRLERIMMFKGKELPDFESFLSAWIAKLGSTPCTRVNDLLLEALALQRDPEKTLQTACDLAEDHPEIFRMILTEGEYEDEQMLRIGLDALMRIPAAYAIRSEIALLTADYAWRTGRKEDEESCLMQAFASDANIASYLRLRFHCQNYDAYRKQVRAVPEDLKNKDLVRSFNTYNFAENSQKVHVIRKNDIYTIRFFEEEFDAVMSEGVKSNSSGWSSGFVKEGLSLFLLLMYNGEVLPKGLSAVLTQLVNENGFGKEGYEKGICEHSDLSSSRLFGKLISSWKKEITLPKESYTGWLETIDQMIADYTDEIMRDNHRSRYEECAIYIAALGEVKESLGEDNGKALLMNRYRYEYGRRSRFMSELRTYGMK